MDELSKNIRIWDSAFKNWAGNGCPLDDPKYPIPGEHPQSDHLWNRDKEAHCEKVGFKYRPNGGGDDDEKDDY